MKHPYIKAYTTKKMTIMDEPCLYWAVVTERSRSESKYDK